MSGQAGAEDDFQALLNEKRTQADRERTEQEPSRRQIRPKIQETGKTEQKDEDVAAQAVDRAFH